MTSLEDDQALIERLEGELISLADRAGAKLTGPDGRAPAFHLIKAEFNYDWKHPPFEASPLSFGYSLFHVGMDALEAGEDVMNYLCGIHKSDPGAPSTNLPVAVSAINFKGSAEGWPNVIEMPFTDGFAIVPQSLCDDFRSRLIKVEALKFPSHSRVSSIQRLEIQEVEFSSPNVIAAVRQVLSFGRTLASNLFPAEANSICYANYPKE